jgi:hypothetical protein
VHGRTYYITYVFNYCFFYLSIHKQKNEQSNFASQKQNLAHSYCFFFVDLILRYFSFFRLGEFLSDCAERICLLRLIHRRVINRFQKFLLWLGYPRSIIQETKITLFCKILSEFALEYRTTRDRITTQKEKKQNRGERNRTRGKLITEVSLDLLMRKIN